MDNIVKKITANSIVVAIYFILTFLTSSFSFLGIQVRIAECLILLCFFRRDYVIGVTLGCIFSNLLSPLGFYDVLFGSLATLVSGLLISFVKHLFLATLIPVIINGFVVGAELYFLMELPFFVNVGTVALGEFIAVSILGYIIIMIVGRKDQFLKLIGAERNFKFRW